MISTRKKEFLVRALIVWAILSAITFVTGYSIYILGIAIGVIAAVLNFSSLLASIERKNQETSVRGKPSGILTFLFFLRYVAIAVIFAALIKYPHHLTGFLIGFLTLYAVFLFSYVKRLKAGK